MLMLLFDFIYLYTIAHLVGIFLYDVDIDIERIELWVTCIDLIKY